MSLPESLEEAATRLPALEEKIRAAEGDPHQLLERLEAGDAGELLVWILSHAPDAASELVDAWGEWEKGADVLLGVSDAELADRGVEKSARKILRKAHHRLRSRGIEVRTEAPAAVARRAVAAGDDPFEAASLSAPDFRGARVGYLASRHPGGGARLFEVRFDEARGILDFKVYNAGRSKVRGFLRSLSQAQKQAPDGAARTLFDVPREALCALVRRASLAQPGDRPLPSGFMEWRGRLFPADVEKEKTPGGRTRAELEAAGKTIPEAAREAAIQAVCEWVSEGAIGPWPPATSRVSDWMDQGRERVAGLEGAARETQIDAWRADAAAALVAEGDRALLVRHLEELAWVRQQTDGESAAAQLIATADALAADDEGVDLQLAAARVDSLFAPFLGELRIGDASSDAAAAGVEAG